MIGVSFYGVGDSIGRHRQAHRTADGCAGAIAYGCRDGDTASIAVYRGGVQCGHRDATRAASGDAGLIGDIGLYIQTDRAERECPRTGDADRGGLASGTRQRTCHGECVDLLIGIGLDTDIAAGGHIRGIDIR